MNNLLDIEQALLSNTAVAHGLQLNEISKLKKAEANAQKGRFTKSVALSKVVAQSHAWFKGDEAKALFAEAGVTWTMEDFAAKVFGWKKAYFHKMVKAGALDDTKIERFVQLCDEAEAQRMTADRSIAALNKWAKAEQAQEGGNKAAGEGGNNAEGEASVVRASTIVTLAFKGQSLGLEQNVSLRIDSEGNLITTATTDQIQFVIDLIKSTLNA